MILLSHKHTNIYIIADNLKIVNAIANSVKLNLIIRKGFGQCLFTILDHIASAIYWHFHASFFLYELTVKKKCQTYRKNTNDMLKIHKRTKVKHNYFYSPPNAAHSVRREMRISKHATQLWPFSSSHILRVTMVRLGEWALERYARTLSNPSATGKEWETLDSSAKQPLIIILTKVILLLIFGVTFGNV